MKFNELMYLKKYEKKIALCSYIVGYYYDSKKNVAIIPLTKVEFEQYSHATIENLSTANKEFMCKSVNKKHMRLHFKATELKKLHIAMLNGNEPELISAETFKKCCAIVGNIKNQNNKGYALELAILGENWNPKKRGVDIDNNSIEIKFMNGQCEI